MDAFGIFLIFVSLLAAFGLVYVSIYNAFQKYLLRINDVEKEIDLNLREWFDLLKNAAIFIKEKTNEDVMIELADLDDMDLSSFELERKLIKISREFYELKYKNKDLVRADNFTNIDFELKEIDAKINGYVSYYNNNIEKYNELVKLFPTSLVAIISKFKEKRYYDGKNMNDKNINDVKL